MDKKTMKLIEENYSPTMKWADIGINYPDKAVVVKNALKNKKAEIEDLSNMGYKDAKFLRKSYFFNDSARIYSVGKNLGAIYLVRNTMGFMRKLID